MFHYAIIVCYIVIDTGGDILMSEIGSKLKTLRKGRGLTQQQLSEKIGLSRATISNYEVSRRTPHLSELKRIADFYGVSLNYFGIETKEERFELISMAKTVFCNENIPKKEREELYKEIMRLYLQMED